MKWWFGFILCVLPGLAAAQSIEVAVDLARQGRQVTQQQQIFLLADVPGSEDVDINIHVVVEIA